MSICSQGLDAKSKTISVTTKVNDSDPLVRLSNAIDFQHLATLVKPDLMKTPKGFWWLGRKLFLRTHLGVLILQSLFKQTDRGIEERIQQTPVYQVFCGFGNVANWKCPDHTNIESFRNRFHPDTHKKIGHYVLNIARDMGFADPSWCDVDSTVQEANMSYPSDAGLMNKLAQKAKTTLEYMKSKMAKLVPAELSIDMANIKRAAKAYFFLSKNTPIEKKREAFNAYYELVKTQLLPTIGFLENLNHNVALSLPWNIRRALDTVKNQGRQYLQHIAHFIEHHKIHPDKLLAFHCKAVACIRKGKVGKDMEFGRVFQLGRIGGNFMVPYTCQNVRMHDKTLLVSVVGEHQEIFGANVLKSVGTDKGYYSKENIKAVSALGIQSEGIQRPANIKNQPDGDEVRRLKNRRAGVEPLIGHVKEFGLRKSKMKSDEATLASGYRSVMGFNLHQLKKCLIQQQTCETV